MEWFVILVFIALITFFLARRSKKVNMAHLDF